MKRKSILLAVILLTGISFAQEKGQPWFDMDNCAICKHMSAHKNSMMQVKWENHKIDDGILSVAVFPDELKSKMESAHAKMDHTIKKLEAGEQLELCNHCKSMGSLMSQGMKKKELETVAGNITLLTSDDPEVVKKIHAHADKSQAAFKEMVAAQSK